MSSTLNLERTLAVIKPHAIRHRRSILRRIQMAGFHVIQVRNLHSRVSWLQIFNFAAQERCVKLTVEQATKFLHRKSNDCKVSLEIANLSSGPLIVLCLARPNAIELWQRLMGPVDCSAAKRSAPTSLRALYGDADDGDETKNAVYGSRNSDDVRHELQFFFPNSKRTEAWICH